MITNSKLTNDILLIIGENNTDNNLISSFESYYKVIQMKPSNIIVNLIVELRPSLIIMESSAYSLHLLKEIQCLNSTKFIPVIFNAYKNAEISGADAVKVGAIDYFDEYYDTELLLAKIKNFIQYTQAINILKMQANIAMESNPNTGLPGNNAIISNIYYSLEYGLDNVVVYVDLDFFKAYNDKYGFAKGDQIIKWTGNIIKDALSDITDFTFLGHIGGDDFVFIAPRYCIKAITDNIIERFDREIVDYYTPEDFQNGGIITTSRTGKLKKYNLMTISMGGVGLIFHDSGTRFEEISDICSEVKTHAKSYPYSYFYMDKRKGNQRSL